VFGEQHLHRRLKRLSFLLQRDQDHLTLNKSAPEFRPPQRVSHIPELLLLGGLHHRYVNSLGDHDRIVEATANKLFSFRLRLSLFHLS
jgi:hypothetical protein